VHGHVPQLRLAQVVDDDDAKRRRARDGLRRARSDERESEEHDGKDEQRSKPKEHRARLSRTTHVTANVNRASSDSPRRPTSFRMGSADSSTRPPLPRRRVALAAACALGALAALAGGVVAFRGSDRPAKASGPKPRELAGCRLTESTAGYPDRYVTHQLPYKVHPPLPVSGWHGAHPLAFDVLFHSVFHGYLVITFRPDLPSSQLAVLRTWVRARPAERIVGTPTSDPASSRLDLAEWGWELRCDGPMPSRAELVRFAARRGT
jgi:hypothetical protein